MKKITSLIVIASIISNPIFASEEKKKCKKGLASFIATPLFASACAASIYMIKKLKLEMEQRENDLIVLAEQFATNNNIDSTIVRIHKDTIFNPNAGLTGAEAAIQRHFKSKIDERWDLDGKINLLYLAVLLSGFGTAIAGYKSLQKIFSK